MVFYELWQASVQLQSTVGLGASAGNSQDCLALEWTPGGVRMCPSARQVHGQLCHTVFFCRGVPQFPFLQKWGSRMLWMLTAEGCEWLSNGLEGMRWLLTSARLLEGVASPWPWQGCTEGHSKAREGDVRPLHTMGWWPRGCQE